MIYMLRRLVIFFLLPLLYLETAFAESPLAPVKTDTPRETMRTFMEAMQSYKALKEDGDPDASLKLKRATRTLDVSGIQTVSLEIRSEQTVIFLKEVIDRVIVIDYSKIPSDRNLLRWRLKDTEITLHKVTEGERAGEFLFTPSTFQRAREFYQIVRDLPYLDGSGGGALYQKSLIDDMLPDWFKNKTLGLMNWQWLGIILSIFLGYFFKWLVEGMIKFCKYLSSHSRMRFDDHLLGAAEPAVGLIAASGFWFFAINALQFEAFAYDVLTIVTQIIFSSAVIWLFLRLSEVAAEYISHAAQKTDFPLDDSLVPMIRKALRMSVFVLGVLIAIQNLGINVMSLVAGLGLGGLAFALAAKDTAANLFGSIMILWDAPFKVGDWIVADGVEGTVEEVGFRSTRVRTFYNSQFSIPNSQLANANIDNMGRREYRRIKTMLGLTYGTPPEKVEGFIAGVKNIIEESPYTSKDNYHVVFNEYAASSLNILLYCFLDVPDWTTELKERERIFMEIKKLAAKIGVEFAFPTQSLHIETLPAPV